MIDPSYIDALCKKEKKRKEGERREKKRKNGTHR